MNNRSFIDTRTQAFYDAGTSGDDDHVNIIILILLMHPERVTFT